MGGEFGQASGQFRPQYLSSGSSGERQVLVVGLPLNPLCGTDGFVSPSDIRRR